MRQIIEVVSRKGYINTAAHTLRIVAGRIYSLWRVMELRLRGIPVASDVYLGGGNSFFQSHKEHIRVGTNVRFGRFTRVDAGFGGHVRIGDDVLIDDNCFITAQKQIEIGNHVQVSAYSFITDFNHNFSKREVPINLQGCTSAPVVIEDDVWIGAHCIILPGVRIGKGAVIGAGSVVTKSVKPYMIAVGNPAREIKKRP